MDTICMGPTGDFQGMDNFFDINTFQKGTRHYFSPLPMPKYIQSYCQNATNTSEHWFFEIEKEISLNQMVLFN